MSPEGEFAQIRLQEVKATLLLSFKMKYADLDKYVEHLRSYPRQSPKEYLSLDRIERVLKALGNPEKKLKGVQVGGTNGKGSTCAILESILVEAGHKVGVFLSPHLISYTERFRINKKDISEKKLCSYIEKIKPVVEAQEKETGDRLTWFEHLVIVGVLYFVDEKVDIAIFEVGLGGRLDATTCLPLHIKVITNVALDHTQILGNTIKKIAKEKAAIIHKKSKVVTATEKAALSVVIRRVGKTSSQLLIIGDDVSVTHECTTLLGSSFQVKGKDFPPLIHLGLMGPAYSMSLGCALGAIQYLRKQGLKIDVDYILAGAKSVKLPGRFQIVAKNPLTIIDGAHNPTGVKALVAAIKEINQENRKIIIIFTAKDKKDAAKMLKSFGQLKSKVIFCDPKRKNFYSPKELKKFYPKGITGGTLNQSLTKAKKLAGKCGMIVVAGSLYVAGDALSIYQKIKKSRNQVDLISDNQVEQKKWPG